MKRLLCAVLLLCAYASAQQINPNSQIAWPSNCNASGYVYSYYLQSCISAGGSITFQTNTASNSNQSLLNFETSTANSVGLTVTPSNPSGGVEKFEVTGGSYTGNAATATNLASYPTLCSGSQFSQGLSSGSNNCANLTGAVLTAPTGPQTIEWDTNGLSTLTIKNANTGASAVANLEVSNGTDYATLAIAGTGTGLPGATTFTASSTIEPLTFQTAGGPIAMSAPVISIDGAFNYAEDTGAANAYIANPPFLSSVPKGALVYFTAANASTGASTLSVDGTIGSLLKNGSTALTTGDILAGAFYTAMYDGTNWQLMNSSLTGGGGTYPTTNYYGLSGGSSWITSHLSDDGTNVTSTEPLTINATANPTQFTLTYNTGHAPAGVSGSAVLAPDTSGNLDVSENDGTAYRVCTSGNGVCSSGTPGGSSGNLQYNNSGVFGGDADTSDDGAGNISAVTWKAASAGVFTNSAMNLNSQFNVNSANFTTLFHATQSGSDYATEAASIGLIVPSTSSVYQSDALGVYTENSSTATNAVGAYFVAIAGAADTASWAINPLFQDGGYVGVFGHASENDCNIANAGTTGSCVEVNGNVTVNPTNYAAFDVRKPSEGSGTWGYGYKVDDECCDIGMYVGPSATANSSPSMQIRFVSIPSGGGTKTANFFTDPNGYLTDDAYSSFSGDTLQITSTGALQPVAPSTTGPLSCQPGLGDGLNAIPAGTYLQTTCRNETGQTWTITAIRCVANAGSSTCAVTNSAGTSLLTGAITGTSTYANGTQSATTTIASGDYLKVTFVADGTTKQIGIDVAGTY